MPARDLPIAVVAGLTLCLLPATAVRATDAGPALEAQALHECERGRDSDDRIERERHFERGLRLAERAVERDDQSAAAHFAVFCNMGELMRIDGESISSIFQFRRLMAELDRTLALEPEHRSAMASKGMMLLRLPRLLGGDAARGERLLRRVVELDPRAVTSRLRLAEQCRQRGEHAEAVAFAQRALEIASEQGRTDAVREARSILAKIESSR